MSQSKNPIESMKSISIQDGLGTNVKIGGHIPKTSSTFLSLALCAVLASLFLVQQDFSIIAKSTQLLQRFQSTSTKSILSLPERYKCTHEYTVELLSVDPLVIYINNFLKDEEVDYLLELKRDEFVPSLVLNDNMESYRDERYRTSQSAMIDAKDPISQCLSQRMKALLGNLQHIETEPLQLVRYEQSEWFRLHVDWFDKPNNRSHPLRPSNRLGTIFAVLDDNCTGGETFFPDIKGVAINADGEKFKRTDTGTGLLVKPRRGNAVFWNNLLANKTGDPRVVHAGLPVKSGRKIGLNLFSRYFLDSPLIGGED